MFLCVSPLTGWWSGLPHVVGMFLEMFNQLNLVASLPHVVGMFPDMPAKDQKLLRLPHVVGMFPMTLLL